MPGNPCSTVLGMLVQEWMLGPTALKDEDRPFIEHSGC